MADGRRHETVVVMLEGGGQIQRQERQDLNVDFTANGDANVLQVRPERGPVVGAQARWSLARIATRAGVESITGR